MQQTRTITQFQFQCKRNPCSHTWWSMRSDITTCPNCLRHNSAVALMEGEAPVPIDYESHKAQSLPRKSAQIKYRKTF
jgi:hypothetical protein